MYASLLQMKEKFASQVLGPVIEKEVGIVNFVVELGRKERVRN